MSRESLTMVRESAYTTDVLVAMDLAADGGQTALDLSVGTEKEDFTYSANTRNADGSTDGLDLQDGVTANWGANSPKNIRVIAEATVTEGTGAGLATTDRVAVQVFHNEVGVLDSDQGMGDPDAGAVIYAIDGVVLGVKGGDTLRLVAVAGASNGVATLNIASTGKLDLAAT